MTVPMAPPTENPVPGSQAAIALQGPAPSLIEQAVIAARDRMAQGEPMIAPAPDPTPPPAPAPELDAYGNPLPPVDPAQGEAPPELDAYGNPIEPEQVPDGEQPPEVEQAPVDDALLITVPGRRPGEQDLELEVSDPVIAERLRQQRNGYMRGEEARALRQEAERTIAELEEVRTHIAVDPIAFVAQHIAPEFRAELAMSILTDPAMWEQVQPLIETLTGDPDKVQLLRSDLQRRRYEFRETAVEQIAAERQVAANARDVNNALLRILPPALKGEQAQLFLRDCRRTIGDYADQNRQRVVNPAHLPMILADRLRAFGVDPMHAAAQLARSSAPVAPTAPPRSPAPRRSAVSAAPPRPAPTGPGFVASAAARRAVASIAPAGAGAPAGGIPPVPKGAGIKEALEHARKFGAFRGS